MINRFRLFEIGLGIYSVQFVNLNRLYMTCELIRSVLFQIWTKIFIDSFRRAVVERKAVNRIFIFYVCFVLSARYSISVIVIRNKITEY